MDSGISYSEEALAIGLEQQDPTIMQYLYKKLGPMAVKLVSQYGGSHADAEDVFQESILAAFVNVKTGKYTRTNSAKLSTYILQICKYKWLDQRKSAYRQKTTFDIPENSEHAGLEDDHFETEEKVQTLYRLFEQLGDQCKKILKHFYWEKRSIVEIGELMSLDPASAKNQKYRCMKRLKEMAHA
jgi:RNA polymerase sigma factor (sigma-70 family)